LILATGFTTDQNKIYAVKVKGLSNSFQLHNSLVYFYARSPRVQETRLKFDIYAIDREHVSSPPPAELPSDALLVGKGHKISFDPKKRRLNPRELELFFLVKIDYVANIEEQDDSYEDNEQLNEHPYVLVSDKYEPNSCSIECFRLHTATDSQGHEHLFRGQVIQLAFTYDFNIATNQIDKTRGTVFNIDEETNKWDWELFGEAFDSIESKARYFNNCPVWFGRRNGVRIDYQKFGDDRYWAYDDDRDMYSSRGGIEESLPYIIPYSHPDDKDLWAEGDALYPGYKKEKTPRSSSKTPNAKSRASKVPCSTGGKHKRSDDAGEADAVEGEEIARPPKARRQLELEVSEEAQPPGLAEAAQPAAIAAKLPEISNKTAQLAGEAAAAPAATAAAVVTFEDNLYVEGETGEKGYCTFCGADVFFHGSDGQFTCCFGNKQCPWGQSGAHFYSPDELRAFCDSEQCQGVFSTKIVDDKLTCIKCNVSLPNANSAVPRRCLFVGKANLHESNSKYFMLRLFKFHPVLLETIIELNLTPAEFFLFHEKLVHGHKKIGECISFFKDRRNEVFQAQKVEAFCLVDNLDETVMYVGDIHLPENFNPKSIEKALGKLLPGPKTKGELSKLIGLDVHTLHLSEQAKDRGIDTSNCIASLQDIMPVIEDLKSAAAKLTVENITRFKGWEHSKVTCDYVEDQQIFIRRKPGVQGIHHIDGTKTQVQGLACLSLDAASPEFISPQSLSKKTPLEILLQTLRAARTGVINDDDETNEVHTSFSPDDILCIQRLSRAPFFEPFANLLRSRTELDGGLEFVTNLLWQPGNAIIMRGDVIHVCPASESSRDVLYWTVSKPFSTERFDAQHTALTVLWKVVSWWGCTELVRTAAAFTLLKKAIEYRELKPWESFPDEEEWKAFKAVVVTCCKSAAHEPTSDEVRKLLVSIKKTEYHPQR